MSEILIQCQDLHKRYGRKEALCGVNLRLESGKIVGLLGPNGSGKTTFIKILNGLLKPDQGMVTIDGEETGIHTKSVISYLPDKPYFADWMKVSDLFDLFADFYEDKGGSPLSKYKSNKYSKYTWNDNGTYVTTNLRVRFENEWMNDLQYLCEPTEYHEKRVTVKFIF